SAILDQETPNGTLDYAKTRIFDPLNITNYHWNLDRQGIPNGATLLHLTPRDMAKFGFLYLNNGSWNGTQLIPSSWVADSTTSFINVGFDQGHGSGYGYKWWLYNWENAYTARGSNGQHIAVIPGTTVVTHLIDGIIINEEIIFGIIVCIILILIVAIGTTIGQITLKYGQANI
ncbi:unnamed protein product, partial [marine sediment metagenome]